MIEKIKAYLQRINPKSPVFISIVGVFLVIFLSLIFTAVKTRSEQEMQTTTENTAPTPEPTRVLTPGRDFVQGQLNVKFEDGVTDAVINERLLKYNARIKSTISGINVKVVEVPIGQEDATSKQLIEDGVVQYAELDHVAHSMVNDTNFGNQYGFKNTGQSIKGNSGKSGADSQIEPAWEVTKGGGVKIAVLDTGIDMQHADLSSKVSIQKFFITSSADDKHGHGTHVAGVIAASTNNGQGIAGACPDCSMMIGKVLDDQGNGPYSVIAEGIIWAADNSAKVINMSVGGYDDDITLRDAVNYAWDKGAVVVAAAGNDNTNRRFYPGAYDKVITVAATDNNDQKASFSNYGDWVEVTAAGKDIFSTLPTHTYYIQNGHRTALNYDYLSGTSMATPLVSGVVGLLWASQYGTSNQAIVNRLYETTDKIAGTGSSWTKGRVNASAAVGGGNRLPKGVVDEYSCNKIKGWAFDPDESGKSITVHVYVNGAVGTPNAEGNDLGATAVSRPDVNSAHGITGTHGFDWPLPAKYRDGKAHEVFVYAIDSQGGTNPEIGKGKTGNCSQDPQDPIKPTNPTITAGPSDPPPFVCGGSPNSICTSPTVTIPPDDPGQEECLDPRGTREKINDWAERFIRRVNNYINAFLGNPQNPPPPPIPCITQ